MLSKPKHIKIGTNVKIKGFDEWHQVTEANEAHFRLDKIKGLFQYGQILAYTNLKLNWGNERELNK